MQVGDKGAGVVEGEGDFAGGPGAAREGDEDIGGQVELIIDIWVYLFRLLALPEV